MWQLMTRPGARGALLVAWLCLLAGLFVAGAAVLPATPRAMAQQLDAPPNSLQQRRDVADMWRDIRKGARLRLSDPAARPFRAIQDAGQTWREARQQWIIPIAQGLLAAALAGVAVMALLIGRVPIEGGRSGRKVPRFSQFQRAVHWYVASTFILLGLSGLILLLGKPLLIPLIGRETFSAVASAAKEGHNLFGPAFIVGLVALFIVFVRDNIPRWRDVAWFFRGGFLFRSHVPAGKFNGGEKLWFWLLGLLGGVLAVTGILLDFPFLVEELFTLQVSQVLHAAAAVILVAFSFGHIYLGAWGTEGTLEGMTSGCVDENWARQHHDLWLERLRQEGADEARQCQPLHVGEAAGAAAEDSADTVGKGEASA